MEQVQTVRLLGYQDYIPRGSGHKPSAIYHDTHSEAVTTRWTPITENYISRSFGFPKQRKESERAPGIGRRVFHLALGP